MVVRFKVAVLASSCLAALQQWTYVCTEGVARTQCEVTIPAQASDPGVQLSQANVWIANVAPSVKCERTVYPAVLSHTTCTPPQVRRVSTAYQIQFVVVLAYASIADFTENLQLSYKKGVVLALGLDPEVDYVRVALVISATAAGRRRLLEVLGIEVTTTVSFDSIAAANAAADYLTVERLQAACASYQLSAVRSMSRVVVVADTPAAATTSETTFLVVGLIGGGVLLVVALVVLACCMMGRKRESRDD